MSLDVMLTKDVHVKLVLTFDSAELGRTQNPIFKPAILCAKPWKQSYTLEEILKSRLLKAHIKH